MLLSSSLRSNLPTKMSASRLLLFGTSLVRAPRKPLSLPFSPQLFPPMPSLSLRHYSSSAAAAIVTVNANTTEPLDAASQPHPWHEWVTFIDRLKFKGYLVDQPNTTGLDYKDMNFVKDACLSFARDRFDLFKLLSTEDIERVVGSGCPNLLRKAVNSAKRLRAYVRLDEGDVCSTCNLRGSCDRAYVVLKESEAAARTVDIVRLLLYYALDPIVISRGEKPPGRDHIDVSARNLLSELTKLSEKSCDLEHPMPTAKVPPQKKQTVSGKDDNEFINVEMKRGDWMCHKCNFLNFSKNLHCLKCKENGPKNVGVDGIDMKTGDWICPDCNFMNFARNVRCLKCKAKGPNKVDMNVVQMKKGDWNCPTCEFMNFASNKKCLRCQEKRPKRQLNPGEWECPSCDFVNFRMNQVCLKCKHERPKEIEEEEDNTWRRPKPSY